ncbi:MAG TPA: RNA pseudouridine synthase, partial [Lentzea sp.]|nr:RNA pseudouridine synthase [Lentzea sp.]
MRVDAGLAKLLGLSRTTVAAIVDADDVLVDGRVVGKSDRLTAGAMLEITLPAPPQPVTVQAIPVEGMIILHEDDDIIVIDKPVGVAVHPSPGWTGPTVVGGFLASGHRVATSGAAERQGVVHRL